MIVSVTQVTEINLFSMRGFIGHVTFGVKGVVFFFRSHQTLIKSVSTIFSQDKLFAMHTDSLFCFLWNNNTEMKKRFLKNKGPFYYPCNFSVSPGASCFNLCQNFGCKDFTNKFIHSAIYSILAFGTNELLQGFDLISSFFCDRGYIPRTRCTICIRNKLKKHGLHGRPKMVREYRKLMH